VGTAIGHNDSSGRIQLDPPGRRHARICEPAALTPAQFGKVVSDAAAEWANVIKSAKIKVE